MTDKEMQSLGGKARAASMTAKERSDCASKAALTRWGKPPKLTIPLSNQTVSIHGPISEDDFTLLISTLTLWKTKLTSGAPEQPTQPL